MSITVGINENVIIDKVEITEKEKGTISFTFRNAKSADGAAAVVAVSAFEALGADGYTETGNGDSLAIRLFCPLKPFSESSTGTAISEQDQQKSASESIAEKKNILYQILSVYMTSDKIKMDAYRNAGLTMDNFSARITQESTLQKIMSNLSEDFVRLITPFVGKDEHPVRLLLVKQSATKHFADFRQRFVKDNPFIEDGRIPLETSKLKFTKHEISKGLNDATPTAATAADTAEEKAEANTAESVFGA
jgi:hypothetical protein